MNVKLTTHEAAEMLFNDENANWSKTGAHALVEYLEELEEDLGEEMTFDRVALRCDYSQYDSLSDWLITYYSESFRDAIKSAGIDLDGDESDEEIEDLIRSHILDHGQLVEFPGGIVVSHF